jgi:transketolase
VSEALAEQGKVAVHRAGVKDVFGQSGSAEALLQHYKLMPQDLAAEALDFLKRTD